MGIALIFFHWFFRLGAYKFRAGGRGAGGRFRDERKMNKAGMQSPTLTPALTTDQFPVSHSDRFPADFINIGPQEAG